MKHVFFPLFLAFCTLLPNGFAQAQQQPETSQILRDARQILGGDDGLLRRWDDTPRIAIVYRDTFPEAHLDKTLAYLKEQTGMELGAYARLPIDRLPADQTATFRPTPLADKPYIFDGKLTVPPFFSHRANIFIFFLGPLEATYFSVLTRTHQMGAAVLTHQYAEGRMPCFMNYFASRAGIQFAAVYINPNQEDWKIEACVFEEVTQTMGLAADAEDSAFFSYDDRMLPPGPSQYDRLLLRALYTKEIKTYDPVQKALDHLKTLLDTEQAPSHQNP